MSATSSLSTDVVVAGAGITGSAVAYELSRRGVAVTLIDRGATEPTGASTVPAALINPHRGRTGRAGTRDMEGAHAFWRLVRELEEEGPTGAHRSGVLRVADSAKQARAWRSITGTRWLEAAEAPSEYHAPFGAMLVEVGGWLRPSLLLASLRQAATARGAAVLWGTELESVQAADPSGNAATAPPRLSVRVRRAEHDGPAFIHCRALVVATGALQPAGLRLPRLELVWGAAGEARLAVNPPLPLAGGVVAAFDEGSAIITGGHRAAGWLGEPAPPGATGREAEELLHALAWRLPAAKNATVHHHWEGVRAKRPSGEPVIRSLGSGVHLMLGFGGRGFLRAAAAAEVVATRLAGQLGFR